MRGSKSSLTLVAGSTWATWYPRPLHVLQEQPEGLVTIRIDAETGKPADINSSNSLFEVFRVENAPRQKEVVKSTSAGSGGAIVNAPETEDEIVEDIF